VGAGIRGSGISSMNHWSTLWIALLKHLQWKIYKNY